MITFYFIASFQCLVDVFLFFFFFVCFFHSYYFVCLPPFSASFGKGDVADGAGNQEHHQHQLKRQRRETTKKPSQEDMLLVQSIQITDKFGFDKLQQQQSKGSGYDTSETVFIASDVTAQGFCVNAIGKLPAFFPSKTT